jgi:subtilisin-like proprotein convertase family protein
MRRFTVAAIFCLVGCEGTRVPVTPDAGLPMPVWDDCALDVEGAPLALADSTTRAVLDIPAPEGADVLQTVSVSVTIRHAYPRDLELALVSPLGTVVQLAADRDGGYEGVIFSDDAPPPGAGALTGPARPVSPLGRLKGEPAGGRWTLEIRDDAQGDVGELERWGLTLSTCAAEVRACAGGRVRGERLGSPIPTTDQIPILTRLKVAGVGDATVADVRFGMSIRCAISGDVDAYLYAPSLAKVELTSDNGGFGDDYVETWFSDAAEEPVDQGYAPFTGVFRSEEPLAKLAGLPAAGLWFFEALDDTVSTENPGIVRELSLELELCELPCPAGAEAVVAWGEGGTIPPGGELAVPIPVALAGRAVAVAVRVSAGGPEAPVTLSLANPAGTTARLGTGAFQRTFFSGLAALALGETQAPHTEHVRPEETLAPLTGVEAQGSWSLRASGTGSVEAVELYLCVAP